MQHTQRVKTKEQGASLIQMLVGIAVAAFVLVIAGEMYYTVRHSYTRTVTQLVDNTEASVVAQAFRNLVDQSTSPSPYGLWPWQQVDLRVTSSTFNPLSYPPVYAATSLNFYAPPNHVAGTDILMLQGVVSSDLSGAISASDSPVNITTGLKIGDNDYILLADQTGYQVMKATADASGSSVPVEQGPARSYAAGSFLAQYHVYILYLRDQGGVKSLMINVDNAGSSQELIANVDDLQIRYYANGAWNNVQADGTANYLEPWYKAVKGIEISYTVSGKSYTILIALKANVL
ncbi:PulJ/GspJ family protein [Cysteiniphilum litorale]|uniref:PulJ/GspJ family protein n=1 Tax=Cysteiniphilum litorale TaxID=2056700 RepID=UPI003F885DE6